MRAVYHLSHGRCSIPVILWIKEKRILTVPPQSLRQRVNKYFSSGSSMAQSRFEYVRQFEQPDRCLPNCWMVVRIDGKGFHGFSNKHNFEKPNDDRSLQLMSKSAENILQEFKDIILAYGQSDEYSFVFKKKTEQYNRRASKLMTNISSLFASSYVYHWKDFFGDQPLLYPPAFDGRVVLYPTDQNLRDYLSWRQADCHINNLYNTCFWNLVQKAGMTTHEAQERLKGTVSSDKNELLFSQFSINYNDLPELYRKGTVVIKQKVEDTSGLYQKTNDKTTSEGSRRSKAKKQLVQLNVDIIGESFWKEHPDLLHS